MKKNDLLILSGTLIYAILFFHQSAGINFLLFNLFLVAALLIKDIELIKQPSWKAVAIASLASSICVLIYGNTLSVVANLISILFLASLSFHSASSLVFAGFYSSFTFVSAIPYMIMKHLHPEPKQEEKENNWGIKFLIVALPFLVALIFFFIYRSANPVFKSYTDAISFDFISFEWVRFLLLGWILLYAFFNQVHIPFLFEKDEKGSDVLMEHQFATKQTLQGINYENLSGIVLFSLLNVLILFLNSIDFHSILFSDALPERMSHSELVHQGIELLIVSILIAISIILFYFRGALNFFKSNNAIKVLAYVWIFQNIILLITTAVKNQWYIDEYSLTYKRIGVYFYLLLTLVGLITTFIKISRVKSNWFLFRKNAWIFYGILICSCFFNWDLIITRYNLSHSENPDIRYLETLSATALPKLIRYKDTVSNSSTVNYDYSIYDFLSDKEQNGWQSFTIEGAKVSDELDLILSKKVIRSINLSSKTIESINCLQIFKNNLEELNLSHTRFKALGELAAFENLKNLDLSYNQLFSLNSLPLLPSLKKFNIASNNIADLKVLKNCPGIEELDIRNVAIDDFGPILELKNLRILHCYYLSPEQSEALKEKFPELKIFVGESSVMTTDSEVTAPVDTTTIRQ